MSTGARLRETDEARGRPGTARSQSRLGFGLVTFRDRARVSHGGAARRDLCAAPTRTRDCKRAPGSHRNERAVGATDFQASTAEVAGVGEPQRHSPNRSTAKVLGRLRALERLAPFASTTLPDQRAVQEAARERSALSLLHASSTVSRVRARQSVAFISRNDGRRPRGTTPVITHAIVHLISSVGCPTPAIPSFAPGAPPAPPAPALFEVSVLDAKVIAEAFARSAMRAPPKWSATPIGSHETRLKSR